MHGQVLTADTRQSGTCISPAPFDPFSRVICDCYDVAVQIGTPIHSVAAEDVIFFG